MYEIIEIYILIIIKMHIFEHLKDINLKDVNLKDINIILQYCILKLLKGSKAYEISQNVTLVDDVEFFYKLKVVKYKRYFIDGRGIFTEKEILEQHSLEHDIIISKLYYNHGMNTIEIESNIEKTISISEDNYLNFSKCTRDYCDLIINSIKTDIILKFLIDSNF